jgi:hypothetical protein
VHLARVIELVGKVRQLSAEPAIRVVPDPEEVLLADWKYSRCARRRRARLLGSSCAKMLAFRHVPRATSQNVRQRG